ncbi:acyl-homoserine-lactone synthase [Pseudomonas sp. TH31]|uniref:acyl-homoserine-lactone synthase n=1 Tax=Pseudomonas sp. TH31 TaxID=2796396 RepID=UPI0019129DC3|nr:acyl-homoserine-lactone synthase [Pseudomonas sp. TH31]MBK5416197.1 acyl-homoserine-lactone synthase [Pseudomonas sp. TH31]
MKDIEFYYINYASAAQPWLHELYRLRKEVFADRLNWNINIRNGIEHDEFDSVNTTYLVGTWKGVPLASLRLINTVHPYMVEGPFRHFFRCDLPKHHLTAEASRFFVDKTRSRLLGLSSVPLSEMLLFTMHNYAVTTGLGSIITVVSNAMARIVRKGGWHYNVLDTGEASPGEKVLLLEMPVTAQNHKQLLAVIAQKYSLSYSDIIQWPHHQYQVDKRRICCPTGLEIK